jgi:hypothetical protein
MQLFLARQCKTLYICCMKDETITIRIESGLKKALQKMADKEDRKLSDYIHLLLKKAAEKK